MKQKVGIWADEWTSVSPEGLGVMRIFTALFLLCFLIPGEGMNHLHWIAGLPDALYAPPPGPMMLGSGFPSVGLLLILQAAAGISLICMLFGYQTRAASLSAGTFLLVLQGIFFSVGKIDHEILIPMVPLLMAFSNWGYRYSVDERRGESVNLMPQSWPLTMIALLIGFMMFTAGFPKILGGWLDPSTQATTGHLLNQIVVRERDELLAVSALMTHVPVFWELLDWGTVIFEVGFLIAVFKRKWFLIFLCAAVLFHFSTMLTLNIAFLPNFVAYALFLNWDSIHEKFRNIAGSAGNMPLFFGAVMALLFLAVISADTLIPVLKETDLRLYEAILVSGAVLVVVAAGLMAARSRLKT